MEGPQAFTFIPFSGQTETKTHASHSLVRSHAMQAVWGRKKGRSLLKQRETNPKATPTCAREVPDKQAKDSPIASKSVSFVIPIKGRRKSVARGPKQKVPSYSAIEQLVPTSSSPEYRADTKAVYSECRSCISRDRLGPGDNCHNMIAVDVLTPPDTPPSMGSPGSIGLGTLDPFGASDLPLNPMASLYIDHYCRTVSWRLGGPKTLWLSFAIEDKALFHGMLFLSAAHFSMSKDQKLAKDALTHQGETIRLIRERLEDPIHAMTDSTIGAILRLCCAHIICGSMDAWNHHMNGLVTIVRLRGGVEKLGMNGNLEYGIESNVIAASLLIDYKIPEIMLADKNRDRMDLSTARVSRFAEGLPTRYGRTFQRLVCKDGLSQGLVDVCTGAADLSAVFDLPNQKHWTEGDQLELGRCFNNLLFLVHKLINEFQKSTAPNFKVQRMRECTRHAALLFLIGLRETPLGGTPYQIMLKKSRSLLAGTDLENVWGGGERGGLLLWVLVTAGLSMHETMVDRTWFLKETLKVARKLGVGSWEEAKDVCKGFLWSDSVCEKSGWRFWADSCLVDGVDG